MYVMLKLVLFACLCWCIISVSLLLSLCMGTGPLFIMQFPIYVFHEKQVDFYINLELRCDSGPRGRVRVLILLVRSSLDGIVIKYSPLWLLKMDANGRLETKTPRRM